MADDLEEAARGVLNGLADLRKTSQQLIFEDLPWSMRSLSDPVTRDRARDAWSATSWIIHFVERVAAGSIAEDELPKLSHEYSTAIDTLCSLGALPPAFRNGDPNELQKLQDLESLQEVKNSCLLVRLQLERQPTVTIGWEPDDDESDATDFPACGRSTRLRSPPCPKCNEKISCNFSSFRSALHAHILGRLARVHEITCN
ncbi:MAG: hypothetical protein AAGD11_18705 [Planctomycetota bacterium]